MDKVTGEQCREAWEKAGRQEWVRHHKCGVCGAMVGYEISDRGPAFNSNCDCSSRWSEAKPISWDEFAEDTMNMQTPEGRARMWERFIEGRPIHEPD